MIQRLKECYATALIFKPAYTIKQMLNKAIMSIKVTGLYTHSTIEWGGFLNINQTWPEFKSHFVKAYDAWLINGVGNDVSSGYQGVLAARKEDDGSIISMVEGVTSQLSRVQLDNNTLAQATNAAVSQLAGQVAQLQQQLTMMTTASIPPTV